MSKNLVIVESPAKAKTIEGYLGKDFTVKSSFGPELKKLSKEAEVVWLATDEDREGEAISWHLYETLDLKKKDTKRITFNEITKTAILKAIDNPRIINKQLVDAQQARRVLDRIVGFELSPVLWKKVRPSLSAGRVQSVAVKLIVEREKEIDAFNVSNFFRITGNFESPKGNFKAEFSKQLSDAESAKSILETCKVTDFFVEDIQQKPATKSPAAPFTTSTLQQEASLKLGFSVTRTMSVAQRLYESGKITYMRTDSVNLSDTAINASKAAITELYGSDFSKTRKYANKNAGAQEAHEAIRPTDFMVSKIDGESEEQNLYELIWKRAIASQMSDAQLERTTIKIGGLPNGDAFNAKGEVIRFEGFLKVYLESSLDDNEEESDSGLLPAVVKNEKLDLGSAVAVERFTRPPSRYVEASLVKKLEELGIGRP
ncbi:MAG: type I DNA topoisomerase, partial [Crocinitomicaceae bacterium]|nr:type I DNA topoisomerase [Crocinitomicaceae bacterium]